MAITTLNPTFKAQPSCLATNNIWKIFADCPINNGVCWYYLQGPPITSSCLPQDYSPSSTAYYSPASCPSGYTSACDETRTAGTVTETAYTCCPTVATYSCQKDAQSTHPWKSTLACYSTFSGPGVFFVTASSTGKTSMETAAMNATDAINAYGIQVRFQSTDFTTSSSSSSSSSKTGFTTPSTFTGSNQTSHPQSISRGAIAGIVAGAIIGILAMIVFLMLVVSRRKQKATPLSMGGTVIYHEKDSDEDDNFTRVRAELDSTSRIVELPTSLSVTAPAVELEARDRVPPKSRS